MRMEGDGIVVYTALYRKFRPVQFGEMVGQEHITKTITNQILSNRVGHAYLFSGGRGTGKTSAAKILARAANCLDLQKGEPCNKCEICIESLNGSLTDIVEMDAASNNSVEDIRDIRETVNFLPAKAKYRVYIIDEVHMLSTGAFNALLKTLEEPPTHVKFILATTEPQKLPATILSRCQRFDFKRISTDDVIQRLKIICDGAKIEITKEALKLIAVLSEGAMRDAISILERCVQDTTAKVTEDRVRELVGIPKLVNINKLTKSILEYDVQGAMQITEELIQEGQELSNLLWEITKYIKDVLVYKTSKKLEIYSKEEIANISELSELATNERLLNLVYELSELENRIKWSNQKQIIFQTGVMKMCIAEITEDNIPKKVADKAVEKQAAKAEVTSVPTVTDNVGAGLVPDQTPTATKKEEAQDASTNKEVKNWKNIVEDLKKSGKIVLYTNLINTKAIEINDMTIGISFEKGLTGFGKTIIENPENMKELERLISLEYGKEMRIKLLNK